MLQDARVPKGWVITRVGDTPVSNIDELQQALANKKHGEKVPFNLFAISSRASQATVIVSIDRCILHCLLKHNTVPRKWFPFARGDRVSPLSPWEGKVLADRPMDEKVERIPAT